MRQDLLASQSPHQDMAEPSPRCPQAALLCLLPLSSLQQPLNLLISKPGKKRRNSTTSLPRDTLCVLLGVWNWGQQERGVACLRNGWDLGGSLRNPTGSTQSTHPCWSRTAVRIVPMRWPGDTEGAKAWETSWGHTDDAPPISCTHLGSAGAEPKSLLDQHHSPAP